MQFPEACSNIVTFTLRVRRERQLTCRQQSRIGLNIGLAGECGLGGGLFSPALSSASPYKWSLRCWGWRSERGQSTYEMSNRRRGFHWGPGSGPAFQCSSPRSSEAMSLRDCLELISVWTGCITVRWYGESRGWSSHGWLRPPCRLWSGAFSVRSVRAYRC